MNDWQWKKRVELVKQLKFFGAKKLTFISEYARKPRVLIKAKAIFDYDAERLRGEAYIRDNIKASEVARQAQASALYQTQLDRGIQGSVFGYIQRAAAQQAMGQAQSAGGLGGPDGLGSQLMGGRFI